MKNNNRFGLLIFSMLTATASGAAIAFLFITISQITITSFSEQQAAVAQVIEEPSVDISIIEEADQDPSFVSKFSRVFIYSADDGRAIIESAKNSLPHTAKTKVTSPAYLVIDLDRDAIILEKNSEKLVPIASITKLVTAVVAKKILNQDNYVTINKEIASTYGNEAKFRIGEKIKTTDLLYPLLMVSSNDAAEALAQSYKGGRKSFIVEMNAWVNSIGAYRTYFADPSGLSPANVSTAKDLAIITKWILKNEPELFEISLLKSKTVRTHTWINPTHFLNLTSYAGGKNGYTPEANRTSVALFKIGKQERLYAIVLLDSSSRDSDLLGLLEEAVR
jgi:D-alanyl-D-alanine carboxypeptidase